MLECEVKNGWEQFLGFIESRCSSAEFENWIAPIRCVEATLEEVTLEVPNIYVQNYLLDNFKEVLADFLPLRQSGDPAIRFVVAETQKGDLSSPAPLPEAEESSSPNLKLNPLYIFENFIEGPSNQIGRASCRERV